MYRADLIRAAKGAQDLTNREIAEKSKVSEPTVSKILGGDPKVELPKLNAVCEALGVKLQDLFLPIAS